MSEWVTVTLDGHKRRVRSRNTDVKTARASLGLAKGEALRRMGSLSMLNLSEVVFEEGDRFERVDMDASDDVTDPWQRPGTWWKAG